MSDSVLVVGAGVLGSRAAMLAERGGRVTRGQPPGFRAPRAWRRTPRTSRRLARLAEGAAALYNCANPPYLRWPADWPPIAASAARRRGTQRRGAGHAVNLYGYGPRVPGGYARTR